MSSCLASQLKLIGLLLFALVITGCDLPGQPAVTPTPAPVASPAPARVSSIQRGDGSDLVDRLLDAGVIRVGIRVWPAAEFSPPAFRGFTNARAGGPLTGFEVDLARAVAEGLGLELELVEAHPPAIVQGDWRGQWDIAIASLVPFDPVPAAGTGPAALVYSRPYAFVPMGVLIPAGTTDLETVAQLAGRRVGVLADSPYQALLAPNGAALTVGGQPLVRGLPPDLQPVPLSSLVKAIHELGQSGETGGEPPVEALFGPAPVFQEALKAGLLVRLLSPRQPVGVQPLAIAAMPQEGLKVDRLMAEIDRVLAGLDRQGALAEMSLRWYQQDLSRPPNP